MKRHAKSKPPAEPAASGLGFRSAAVARIAQMPVATLRIWEQRYRAVQPATTASGHRVYSPGDVQRVLLLRQLTGQGHAIGSIAPLDSTQLQEMARMPATMPMDASQGPVRAAAGLRVLVAGPVLAARLRRPELARHLAHPIESIAVFESLADAMAASSGAEADLLLWHAPELQQGLPPELQAVQQAGCALQVAVLYRFASSAAKKALTDAGALVIREPADDDALGAWLASIESGLPARRVAAAPAEVERAAHPPGAIAPRRFDDAALTAIAGLSPRLSCECPRHIAELLMQLASFEAYSAGCISMSSADAELHAYLQQVAGTSRALFEAALERVARHERLPLP
jgi:DNA-binding transcriptional MerR regulator